MLDPRVPEKPPPDHEHHVPKPVYGVKEIVPVLLAPRTMQYMNANRKLPIFPAMPSEHMQCEGWGRAAIKNMADWLDKSFADKYIEGMGDTEWHYIQLDGWIIHFWNPEYWQPSAPDDREMLPAGWIDLRMVQAVETEMLHSHWNMDCPYEIKVLMRTGYMSFFVRKPEEAARWREVIESGFAEHQIREEAKRVQALESSKDIQSRTVDIGQVVAGAGGATYERGQNGLLHLSVDPSRERDLRNLWVWCVRASVGQGDDLHDAFKQIFDLYDFDGNGNLRMDELEIMVRELLAVRHAEYKKALKEQDEVVLSQGRTMLNGAEEERTWMKTVGHLSARLKQTVYGYMMQEEGFQKRVAVIRSHLDISHDGVVTREEFVLRGPLVILSLKELQLEASFYGHCSKALKKATRQQRAIRALVDGEDSESSDEGCLQS